MARPKHYELIHEAEQQYERMLNGTPSAISKPLSTPEAAKALRIVATQMNSPYQSKSNSPLSNKHYTQKSDERLSNAYQDRGEYDNS